MTHIDSDGGGEVRHQLVGDLGHRPEQADMDSHAVPIWVTDFVRPVGHGLRAQCRVSSASDRGCFICGSKN